MIGFVVAVSVSFAIGIALHTSMGGTIQAPSLGQSTPSARRPPTNANPTPPAAAAPAPIDVFKTALTVVAGIGGAVALVVAYRRQRDLESGRFVERFGAAAAQLGDADVAVRIAGVYAIAGVADASQDSRRQQCIDVLCGYLRLPYEPKQGRSHRSELVTTTTKQAEPPDSGTVAEEVHERLRQNDHEVRQTILRIIDAHLQLSADPSWSTNSFDFTGAVLDDASFRYATFGGVTSFNGVMFTGRYNSFDKTTFSGDHTTFDSATFSAKRTSFDNAEFQGGDVSFEGAHFTDRSLTSFNETLFGVKHFSFDRASIDNGDVAFDKSTFSGERTSFRRTTIEGNSTVSFRESSFAAKETSFERALFGSFTKISFARAKFIGPSTSFAGAAFNFTKASFGEATFSGETTSFERARFDWGAVDFQAAMFGAENTSFDSASFGAEHLTYPNGKVVGFGDISFRDVAFDGNRTTFDNTSFSADRTYFAKTVFSAKRTCFDNAAFTVAGIMLDKKDRKPTDYISFDSARFVGAVTTFNEAQFVCGDMIFNDARFNGEYTSFGGATFSGENTSFEGAIFNGSSATFDAPRAWNSVSFDWDRRPDVKDGASTSTDSMPECIRRREWPPAVPASSPDSSPRVEPKVDLE